jgi:spermidine synthase
MPCYTVQTCSVNLEKADHDLLEKALKEEGWTVYRSAGSKAITFTKNGISGSYRNNKLEFSYSSGSKPDTDVIKRAYSKETVQLMADRYAEDGWETTQDGDEFVFTRPSAGYGTVYA